MTDIACISYHFHEFSGVVKSQMNILQQHPASFCHGRRHESAGMYLLTLTHRDITAPDTCSTHQTHNNI